MLFMQLLLNLIEKNPEGCFSAATIKQRMMKNFMDNTSKSNLEEILT